MRKKGIIGIVIFILLCIGLTFLFTDRWLERQIEENASLVVGAKVEIDELDFSLTDLRMRWRRLQVTNPRDTWNNAFETGQVSFKMEVAPLLEKKYIIREVILHDLQLNTKRQTDGKLPEELRQEKPGLLAATAQDLLRQVSAAPAWNLGQFRKKINVDSLIRILDIQSPQRITLLCDSLQARYVQWDRVFKQTNFKNDLDWLESEIPSLDPRNIKTIVELQDALVRANRVKKKVDSLHNHISTSKNLLVEQINDSKTKLTLVDDWIREDWDRALAKAKTPFSGESISRFLFGPLTVGRLEQVMYWTDRAREYLAQAQEYMPPQTPKPVRFKGQDVPFPSDNQWPKWWIQLVELSGRHGETIQLQGRMQDLSADQRLTGKPSRLQLKGTTSNRTALEFNLESDHRQATALETMSLQVDNIPLPSIRLADVSYLPQQVDKSVLNLQSKLTLNGNNWQAGITAALAKVDFRFSQAADDEIVSRIRQLFADLPPVHFSADMSHADQHTTARFQSDIDNLFSQRMRELASKEAAEALQRLKKHVEDKAKPYREKMANLISEKQQYLEKTVAEYEAQLQTQQNKILELEKEIKEKIDKEKNKRTDQVKEKAQKGLQDLLIKKNP